MTCLGGAMTLCYLICFIYIDFIYTGWLRVLTRMLDTIATDHGMHG